MIYTDPSGHTFGGWNGPEGKEDWGKPGCGNRNDATDIIDAATRWVEQTRFGPTNPPNTPQNGPTVVPTVELDKRTKQKLLEVISEERKKFTKTIEDAKKIGIDARVICGYRTDEEQNNLHKQGRDEDGNIINKKEVVTNAKAGQSPHNPAGLNQSLAVDIAIYENGKINWNSPDYQKVGKIGQDNGLKWGGEFTSPKGDFGHFEVKDWKSFLP